MLMENKIKQNEVNRAISPTIRDIHLKKEIESVPVLKTVMEQTSSSSSDLLKTQTPTNTVPTPRELN